MNTPAAGRKLSTADLATPAARTDRDDSPEAHQVGPVVAGPEARHAATDDAGQPVPPLDQRDTWTPRDAEATMRDDAAARTAAASRGNAEPRIDTRRELTTGDEEASALFADDACQALWKRWDDTQAGFVDEPRKAVQDADSLVAETMQQLAETFARERASLEQQWGRGDNVSTEDLRIAFRRYRSFFKRLLSV